MRYSARQASPAVAYDSAKSWLPADGAANCQTTVGSDTTPSGSRGSEKPA